MGGFVRALQHPLSLRSNSTGSHSQGWTCKVSPSGVLGYKDKKHPQRDQTGLQTIRNDHWVKSLMNTTGQRKQLRGRAFAWHVWGPQHSIPPRQKKIKTHRGLRRRRTQRLCYPALFFNLTFLKCNFTKPGVPERQTDTKRTAMLSSWSFLKHLFHEFHGADFQPDTCSCWKTGAHQGSFPHLEQTILPRTKSLVTGWEWCH